MHVAAYPWRAGAVPCCVRAGGAHARAVSSIASGLVVKTMVTSAPAQCMMMASHPCGALIIITFGEYRVLVGLLEHLRVVAQLQAHTTNSLYRPHGRHGETRADRAQLSCQT